MNLPLPHVLESRNWLKIARWGVCACLSLGIGLILWSMLAAQPTTLTLQAATNTPSPATGHQVVSAERIMAAHLFGEHEQDTDNSTVTQAAIITIEGILYSPDPDTARAILTVDGRDGVFKVGDILTDREKITSITLSAVGIGTRTINLEQRIWDLNTGTSRVMSGAGDYAATSDARQRIRSVIVAIPSLNPVNIPVTSDPVTQLQSLRQQLIH